MSERDDKLRPEKPLVFEDINRRNAAHLADWARSMARHKTREQLKTTRRLSPEEAERFERFGGMVPL